MLRTVLIVAATLVLVGTLSLVVTQRASSASGLPANWILAGDHPDNYTVDVQEKALHLASSTARGGFGTAMQTISSAHYVGKNVRFSAQVRSDSVADWAGLWMRIDGQDHQVLAFDNMAQWPIKGTTGWSTYSVVLPVADSAADIAFGILLAGSGNVWIRNLTFEPVSAGVKPTASMPAALSLPLEPNLDLTPGAP
jgi:hypothetical protein